MKPTNMYRVLLLYTVVLLTACGGGTDEPSETFVNIKVPCIIGPTGGCANDSQ